MAAFLLFDKITTWNGSAGELLAGGQFRFFEVDTTTPQDVYGDRALTVNNGVTVDLDASGRLEHECWADTTASYYVELYDADGVKQGEISHIEVPGGQGQVIPVPSSGEYLTGDGTNFLLEDLTDRFLPDQTGHSNEILGTDGTTASWVARPADGVSDISVGTSSVRVGEMLIQYGVDTAPSTGTVTSSKAVTFPTAFKAGETPSVRITPLVGTSDGGYTYWMQSSPSNSAFTVVFDLAEGDRASSNIVSPIPFQWVAMAKVTLP